MRAVAVVLVLGGALLGCGGPAFGGTESVSVVGLVRTATGLAWTEESPRGAGPLTNSLVRWDEASGRKVVMSVRSSDATFAVNYPYTLVAYGDIVYAALTREDGGPTLIRSESAGGGLQEFDLFTGIKGGLMAAGRDFVVGWDGHMPMTGYTRTPLDGGAVTVLPVHELAQPVVVGDDVFLVTGEDTITRFGSNGDAIELHQPGAVKWHASITAIDGLLVWIIELDGRTRIGVWSHRIGEEGATNLAEDAVVTREDGTCLAAQYSGPIAADATHVYWAVNFRPSEPCKQDPMDRVGYAIRRVALGGGAIETLVSEDSADEIRALAVDDTRVYWVASDVVVRYRPK